MNTWLALFGLLLVGLILLTLGGELLVRGAVGLAATARISPLVIGLTVVAFGTSSPEFAVSVSAALGDRADITLGNVVGSNIFNVLLILGVSALLTPLVVASQLVRFDVPLMVAASLGLWGLGWDGRISTLDGVLLFSVLVVYLIWSIRQSRRESPEVVEEFAQEYAAPARSTSRQLLLHLAWLVVGLVLLTWGARWLVDGASGIARQFGMSELLIGLTIVAAGTSLPEVAASVMASLRGERDIAVGNVVGSNLFNILCVLGLSSIIAPQGIAVSPQALHLDIPVMTAVAVACLPIFFTGYRISRWEGALFLGYYVAYTTYLVLAAIQSQVTRQFGLAMVWFVVPLTVITLVVALYRGWRAR